jgi:HEPN domain-containing protein
MTPKDLPAAYLFKATTRLKALAVLRAEQNYSDVVREAQEIVELCSKAILRLALVDPPHKHDVGQELKGVANRFDSSAQPALADLIRANHRLRREREMAFYGANDFDPTEGYSLDDANDAFRMAEGAVDLLRSLLKG